MTAGAVLLRSSVRGASRCGRTLWDGNAAQVARVFADAREVLELAPGPGLVAVVAGQSNLAYVADRCKEANALAGTSISMAARLGTALKHREGHSVSSPWIR